MSDTHDSFASQKTTQGAQHIMGGALDLGPVYTDGTYNYYGEAVPGTALTAAAWRVSRETIATGRIQYAGTGNFAHAYTDIATAAALFA